MKNLLFHLKAVKTGTLKALVGAGAETFWKSEPERKKIVSAPQPWNLVIVALLYNALS
jgi:hypothetical protein